MAFYELRREPGEDDQLHAGQFQMSFEPSAGNVAKGDASFIPPEA
jgi:hypothetical protein